MPKSYITHDEYEKLISHMKPNQYPGSDGLTVELYKYK